MRLGISRALLAFPGDHADLLEAGELVTFLIFLSFFLIASFQKFPLSNTILSSEKLLVRDPRMVERKKPGQKKARKKFAWYIMNETQ